MSEEPLPSDYDSDDGWSDDHGVEKCPHCSMIYSPNGGYSGAVYDAEGTEYDHVSDTDPMDGPFFCPDCWEELEANRLGHENASLAAFGGGDDAE